MAQVNITPKLISDVAFRVERLRNTPERIALQTVPEHWKYLAYAALYGDETRRFMYSVPDGYLPTTTVVYITINDRAYRFEYKTPLRVPSRPGDILHPGWNPGYTVTRWNGNPGDNEYYDKLAEEEAVWHSAKQLYEEETETQVTAAKTFLNSFRTLAPALKAWPALWDLLDDKYKEQHKRVVTRKKSDVPELDQTVLDVLAPTTVAIAINNLDGGNK